MSQALSSVARLRPEIRLAKAVSEFEADLSNEQKARFRTHRTQAHERPPDSNDVMRLTAAVDSAVSRSRNGRQARCIGPRLINLLQSIQQYVGLGDIIIGGSQNLIACGVWAMVRTSLMLVVHHAAYVEKLSVLFMNAGRSAPRYEQLALLYQRSRPLQAYLCEYLLVIVRICHQILKFSKKSYIGQLAASISDADAKQYQADLETWASSIREEVTLQMSQTIEDEASKSSRFRAISNMFSETAAHKARIKQRISILDACSTYDYQTPWKQARKIGNTGLFAGLPEYENWRKDSTSRTLICTGKLGSGKSVLLANIVDDLNIYTEMDRLPVAYFFCRHDLPESLRPRVVLGSLVRQLLLTCPELPPFPEEDSARMSGREMELYQLLEYFYTAFKPQSHCYFVLDGLDECEDSDKRLILAECRTLQERLQLIACISYRLEADNRLQLSLHQFAKPEVFRIPEKNPEIEAYIEAELQARIIGKQLNLGDPTIILEIQDALLQGAQGMFLWVALQISSLCEEKTDERIREALGRLPKTLSETFTHILEKAAFHGQEYQRPILELLAVARRPLTGEELREALSVVPGDTNWDQGKLLNDIHSTLACCGSLVVMDEEEYTVRLVHHSVKSYLLGNLEDKSGSIFELEDANRKMGQIILTYLNYNIFETQLSTRVIPMIEGSNLPKRIINSIGSSSKSRVIALKLLQTRHKSVSGPQTSHDIGQALASHSKHFQKPPVEEVFAFRIYAKKYWVFHTGSISEDNPFFHKALLQLFDIQESEGQPVPWNQAIPSTPSLAVSVDKASLNSPYLGMPAVYWALRNSHLPLLRRQMHIKSALKAVASVLIELGRPTISVQLENWHREMCTQILPFAVLCRNNKLIRQLLKRGASASYRQHCAVATAISECDTGVVQLLLNTYEQSEITPMLNSLSISPLVVASRRQNGELVSLLIHHHVDVTRFQSWDSFDSPLYDILSQGITANIFEPARALLQAGVKLGGPGAPDIFYDLIVFLTRGGDRGFARLFIRSLSLTQLSYFLLYCCKRYTERVFVENDSSVLEWLAERITPQGAVVTTYDYSGQWCDGISAVGHQPVWHRRAMVDLLSMVGAAVNSDIGCDAVRHLLDCRESSIIRLYLLHGFERPRLRQMIAETGLLQCRIREFDHEQIEFLASYCEADMNTQGLARSSLNQQTPLLTAIMCNAADPFRLVMDIVLRGADINQPDHGTGGSPLRAALNQVNGGSSKDPRFYENNLGYLRIVRTLVHLGAQPDEKMVAQLLGLSLSLFPLPGVVLLEKADGEIWPSKPLPLSGSPTLRSRWRKLNQTHVEDSILRHIEQILYMLLQRLRLSPTIEAELLFTLRHNVSGRNSVSLTYVGHIISVLSFLAATTDPERPPLVRTHRINRSDQRPGTVPPSSSLPETLTETELAICDLVSSCAFNWSLIRNSQERDKTVDDECTYPLLKCGDELRNIIVRGCAGIPSSVWEHQIKLGLEIAVSEADVEAVTTGLALLRSRGIGGEPIMVRAAQLMRQRINALPKEGFLYELDATP